MTSTDVTIADSSQARTGISSKVMSQKLPNRPTPASTTPTTSPAKQTMLLTCAPTSPE
jgi:hypothetical protein